MMKKRVFMAFFLFTAAFLFTLTSSPHSGNMITAFAAEASPEDDAQRIKLNVTSKSLVKGKTYTIRVYNTTEKQKITFKSSDSDVVSVSRSGIVTANKVGNATITITVKEGIKTVETLQCEIKVGPPAISIRFTQTECTLSLANNPKTTLKTVIKPNTTTEEPTFYSMDPSIATVSARGKVTAKSAGHTYIVASIENGKYALCQVTVIEEAIEEPSNETEDFDTNAKSGVNSSILFE